MSHITKLLFRNDLTWLDYLITFSFAFAAGKRWHAIIIFMIWCHYWLWARRLLNKKYAP